MKVGDYEIVEELGRGGMGVVYRAREPATRREVALKVLTRSHAEPARRRFLREAHTLARLRHPNVVTVHAAGMTGNGEPFLALELLQGQDLAAHVEREGPVDPRQAAEWIAQAASGLQAAHAAGAIHRDVKPENLLLDGQGRVRVTDFGLVRDVAGGVTDGAERLTKTGAFMGTPTYWPPEQALGEHHRVGPSSDVYGLGGSLFFLLTGEAPQAGHSLVECLAQLERPPRAPSQLRAGIPADLDAIVLCALARQPEERYASADALRADLRRWLDGQPVQARSVPSPSRRPGPVLLGAAALCALGWFAWSPVRPERSPRTPPAEQTVQPQEAPPDAEGIFWQAIQELRARPSREAFERVARALVLVYRPGEDQPLLAQAVTSIPARERFGEHARRLLEAALVKDLDDPASWSLLTTSPGQRSIGPPLGTSFYVALERLQSAEARREEWWGWQLAVHHTQQRLVRAYSGSLLALQSPWGSQGREPEPDDLEEFIRLAPETRSAARLRLLLDCSSVNTMAGGLSEPWPELDDDPALRLLQLGVNLAHGVAGLDALEAMVRSIPADLEPRSRLWKSVLVASVRWVEWAYLNARSRGRPLNRQEVDRFVTMFDRLLALTGLEVVGADECRAGLELLGPDPARALEVAPRGRWVALELRLVQGERLSLDEVLGAGPTTRQQELPGLAFACGAVLESAASRAATAILSDQDHGPAVLTILSPKAYPWHAVPWVLEIDDQHWWPGRR